MGTNWMQKQYDLWRGVILFWFYSFAEYTGQKDLSFKSLSFIYFTMIEIQLIKDLS